MYKRQNLKPRVNDFIIVRVEKNATPILRQLAFKNDKYVLIPFNTKLYNPLDFNLEFEALGIVRQANFEYSRN